jgi:phage tail tube protein FII
MSMTSVGVQYLDYGITTNFTVTYSVQQTGAVRNGVLHVNNFLGLYTWDDEYNQSDGMDFALQANSTTGDIEYTAGESTTLTYKISFIRT